MPSIVASIRVKKEKTDEAKAFFKELAGQVLKNEPGTLAYVFHQRKDDPQVFVAYEKYESEEAFQTHSANLGKEVARFGAVLDGAPDIVLLEEI